MKAYCVILALLVVYANAQNATDVLECYFCDSEVHPDCEVITADTTVYKCNEMVYPDGLQSSRSNQNVQNSFVAEITKRQRLNYAFQDVKYKCISIRREENSKSNLIRTCVEVSSTLVSFCDFIKENAETGVNIKSCNECDRKLCNSSSSLTSNIFVYFSILVLTWFVIKF